MVLNFFFVTKIMWKVKPLCIMLLEIIGYTKSFDQTKFMYFLIKDDELPE